MNAHRRHWFPLPWTLVTAALLGAGCGDHPSPTAVVTSTPPTQEVAGDLAQHFAASLSRQGGVPLDQVGGTNLRPVARGEGAALRTLRTATALDERNFSWSLSVTFFDADGNEQPTFMPGVTARARIHARVRGDVTSSEHTASVGIERLLDVRGLLPADTELHVDGAANDTAHCAFQAKDGSAARHYDLLSVGSLEDLRQLKDASANPYPLSGVLRWHVEADALERTAAGEKQSHYDATIVVTFNGTRYPTIEVEEHWRYQMDLETGEITPLPS